MYASTLNTNNPVLTQTMVVPETGQKTEIQQVGVQTLLTFPTDSEQGILELRLAEWYSQDVSAKEKETRGKLLEGIRLTHSIGSSKFLISGNNLTTLPEVFDLPQFKAKITTVKISHNSLSKLPETLQHLGNLKILELDGNNISSIPEWVEKFSKLQLFSAQDNQLSSLPSTFGNLHSLVDLYLMKNNFSSLPDIFGKLSQLQTFWVWENNVSSFPASLHQCPLLRDLNAGESMKEESSVIIADCRELKKQMKKK